MASEPRLDSARSGLPSGWVQALGPVFGLAGTYLLFALIAPASFRSLDNLETIARQTAIVGAAALGMTMIMVAGAIDLSVGSVVALGSVVIAWLLQFAGASPLVAGLGGILAGTVVGLVSGLLVTRLRVVSFIVTLGMMLAVRGLAKSIAHEQKIDAPLTWLNDLLATLPAERQWMLLPAGVWLVIALALLVAGLLRYTRLGRHIFAVGSNEQTARLCGVPVSRVKVLTFLLGGSFFGLGGLLQFSRLTVGDPTAAVGLELDVIAAVVIGGGSLSGGEGSVFGSLVGALIMSVIRSGCTQMGLPNWVQEVVTGAVIVAAVALDRWRHRRVG
ncbi:MAG: ABC transporter permease [Armatimonadetes bacterium]|nr:ABC transporter permease [Armatimonadota bacterium]